MLEKAEYASTIESGIIAWMKDCESIDDHSIKWEYVKYKRRDATEEFETCLKRNDNTLDKELQLKTDVPWYNYISPISPENLKKIFKNWKQIKKDPRYYKWNT